MFEFLSRTISKNIKVENFNSGSQPKRTENRQRSDFFPHFESPYLLSMHCWVLPWKGRKCFLFISHHHLELPANPKQNCLKIEAILSGNCLSRNELLCQLCYLCSPKSRHDKSFQDSVSVYLRKLSHDILWRPFKVLELKGVHAWISKFWHQNSFQSTVAIR